MDKNAGIAKTLKSGFGAYKNALTGKTVRRIGQTVRHSEDLANKRFYNIDGLPGNVNRIFSLYRKYQKAILGRRVARAGTVAVGLSGAGYVANKTAEVSKEAGIAKTLKSGFGAYKDTLTGKTYRRAWNVYKNSESQSIKRIADLTKPGSYDRRMAWLRRGAPNVHHMKKTHEILEKASRSRKRTRAATGLVAGVTLSGIGANKMLGNKTAGIVNSMRSGWRKYVRNMKGSTITKDVKRIAKANYLFDVSNSGASILDSAIATARNNKATEKSIVGLINNRDAKLEAMDRFSARMLKAKSAISRANVGHSNAKALTTGVAFGAGTLGLGAYGVNRISKNKTASTAKTANWFTSMFESKPPKQSPIHGHITLHKVRYKGGTINAELSEDKVKLFKEMGVYVGRASAKEESDHWKARAKTFPESKTAGFESGAFSKGVSFAKKELSLADKIPDFSAIGKKMLNKEKQVLSVKDKVSVLPKITSRAKDNVTGFADKIPDFF